MRGNPLFEISSSVLFSFCNLTKENSNTHTIFSLTFLCHSCKRYIGTFETGNINVIPITNYFGLSKRKF